MEQARSTPHAAQMDFLQLLEHIKATEELVAEVQRRICHGAKGKSRYVNDNRIKTLPK